MLAEGYHDHDTSSSVRDCSGVRATPEVARAAHLSIGVSVNRTFYPLISVDVT